MSTLAAPTATSLRYTRHATERSRQRRIPTFHSLPPSAALWDIDRERGASRYLLSHHLGPICLVISDWEPGVVITAYDPRRRDHWH